MGDHRTAGDPRRDPEAQHFSPSNRPPVRPRLRYPVIEASQEVVSVCVRGGKVDTKSHWEKVYRTKRPDEVSWYRPHLDVSLRLVHEVAPNRSAAIIDVGGGESTLIDDLLAWGYRAPTILDVSATALAVAKNRIGDTESNVHWLCGDVTTFPLGWHKYDVWHDRAVFHFLTDRNDRAAYVRQVAHAVKPGGHVIVATFGPDAPATCSGLDVIRYDPDSLHDEFGPSFKLAKHLTELHRTPAGAIQQFTYCYCIAMAGQDKELQ